MGLKDLFTWSVKCGHLIQAVWRVAEKLQEHSTDLAAAVNSVLCLQKLMGRPTEHIHVSACMSWAVHVTKLTQRAEGVDVMDGHAAAAPGAAAHGGHKSAATRYALLVVHGAAWRRPLK